MKTGAPERYEAALRTIAPNKERMLECQNTLADCVALLAKQAKVPKGPSPAELRKELIELEAHLKGARAVLANLGLATPKAALGADSVSDRIAILDVWIQSLQPFIGEGYGIIVEQGHPLPSHLAFLACESAYTLLTTYSSRRPSLTKEGPMIQLSDQLLGAADIRGVAVDRAAQAVVRRRRELEEMNRQRRTEEN